MAERPLGERISHNSLIFKNTYNCHNFCWYLRIVSISNPPDIKFGESTCQRVLLSPVMEVPPPSMEFHIDVPARQEQTLREFPKRVNNFFWFQLIVTVH